MKTTAPQNPIQLAGPNRIIDLRWLSVLAIVLGLAFLIVLVRSLVSRLVWCDLTPRSAIGLLQHRPKRFRQRFFGAFFLGHGTEYIDAICACGHVNFSVCDGWRDKI